MSDRYPGGIVVANPTAPAGPYQDGAAPGIWTLEQQAYYKAQGLWPTAGNVWMPLNSLRIRSSASANLTRTPASATNRKTWTWSGWVKRGALDGNYQALLEVWNGNNNNQCINITWGNDNTLFVSAYSVSWRTTTPVYRDPSSWYHLVVAIDTTQATASNRVKIYVNNTQITSFSTSTDPSLNDDLAVNQAATHYLGSGNGRNYSDGYLAEVNFIDGQALTPSSFGQTDATTGVWQAKQYSGTYGTNGYYLPFSDIALTSGSNAGLGKDFSGNGNYWTTNNISVTSGSTYDAMTDVPANKSATVANYATLNPLFVSGSNGSTSDGNLTTVGGGNPCRVFPSTIAASSGKFYAEYKVVGSGNYIQIGVSDIALYNYSSGGAWGSGLITFDVNQIASNYYINSTSATSVAVTTVANDILMVAFDSATRKVWFGKNGTWNGSGDPAAGTNEVGTLNGTNAMMFFCRAQSTTLNANFGQQPWAYTIPSGFKALNTYNLPTPSIVQSDDYFLPVIYTGNDTYPRAITTGFQPDFVWTKARNAGYVHQLYDSVRGTGGSKSIYSSENYNEGYFADYSNLSSFDSTGYTIGTSVTTNVLNNTGTTFVSWNWKANGSSVSNTDGTITSTISASQTSGVSIVTYTGNGSSGATVGHGLGTTPAMIIIKARPLNGADWQVFHKYMNGGSSPWNSSMYFNTNDAQFSYTGLNNTAPSSSVFTLGSNGGVNQNGTTYIAYVFAEVPGFSAFGKYTGNGSATDGPFVYTGFKPAYSLIKTYDNSGEWTIHDNQRPTYNQSSQYLFADVNDSEYDNIYNNIDYLANGFKCRGTTGTNQNGNGYNYIYMAFAENPFKYALAR